MTMTIPSVLVVGSVAYDDLEMPYGIFEDVLGGAAVYSSFASALFAKTALVGVVGEDFKESDVEKLTERSVDTIGLEHAKGKTFRWRGRYSKDLASRESLATELNVFANFSPKVCAELRGARYLLLGNIHPALQLDVLSQVEKPRFVAADTMNFWISGEPKLLGDVLKKIDLLLINDEEARELSGITNIKKAAAEIRKRGPKHLIIKRGEHGALLFDDQGTFYVPGFPLEDVRDPTGAGDTFAGGLFGYLAAKDDGKHAPLPEHTLRRAMLFATSSASFCVEDVGTARLENVTRKDVVQRTKQLLAMLDVGGTLALEA